MSFCSFALRMTIYFLSFHALVGSLLKHNLSGLKNRIIGPNVGSFTAFWIWACFCMATCTLLPGGHFMGVNLKRYLFWTVSSFFLQAFLQVCREFQPASVEQFLHYRFIASGDGSMVHAMQFGSVFLLRRRACQQLEANCAPRLPTYSGTLTIANFHRSSYESKAIKGSVFWLSGLGFSLKGRRVSRSVAEKFWVTLRCKVGKFQQFLQKFSGNPFPILFAFDRAVDKVFYQDSGLCRFCVYVQRLLGWCACLQCWPILYFVKFQLAGGADLGPYFMDSASGCPWPGSEPSARNEASMSWLVPLLCSALCLFFTWVLQKWWKFSPTAPFMEGVDGAMIGTMLDRINAESNNLRREVNFLNGQLSDLSAVVRRLREDLYEVSADHVKAGRASR